MIAYLLEITAFWTIALGLYVAFWQQEQNFNFGRFFLLGTLILGAILPIYSSETTLMNIEINLPVGDIAVVPEGETKMQNVGSSLGWWHLIVGGYFLGVLYNILGLLREYIAIRSTIRQYGNNTFYHGWNIVEIDIPHVSYATGRSIIISKHLSPKQRAIILQHEAEHLHQRHGLDLWLIEGLRLLFWFHPLVYCYRNYLRTLHEYQADAAVLKQVSLKEYGNVLLQQTMKTDITLCHSFNHYSHLKKRIKMMKKRNSSKTPLLKYGVSLPFLFVFAFCLMNTNITEVHAQEKDAKQPEKMPYYGDCGTMEGDEQAMCSQQAIFGYIGQNLSYPKSAKEEGVEGMVVVRFVVGEAGALEQIKIVKSLSEDCDAEVLRIMEAMPSWTPAQLDGKPIAVEMNLPIKFKLDDGE